MDEGNRSVYQPDLEGHLNEERMRYERRLSPHCGDNWAGRL